jgi:DNA-binding NarL/FixJ family response regulator
MIPPPLPCIDTDGGPEAIPLFKEHGPDVTLMDLRLPGMSGVEAIRAMRAISPEACFVVLTTYDGDEDIHQTLKGGAQGYLIKEMPALFIRLRRPILIRDPNPIPIP